MRSSSSLARLLVPAAFAVAMLTFGSAPAATPPAGTINSGHPSEAWVGQLYAASVVADPAECPPLSDPGNVICDHYSLTVSETGGVQITISWASDCRTSSIVTSSPYA